MAVVLVPGARDGAQVEPGDVKAELEVVKLVKAEQVVDEALKIPPAEKDAVVVEAAVWVEKSVGAVDVAELPPDGIERLKAGGPPAGGAENSPMVRTGAEEVAEVEAAAVEVDVEAEDEELSLWVVPPNKLPELFFVNPNMLGVAVSVLAGVPKMLPLDVLLADDPKMPSEPVLAGALNMPPVVAVAAVLKRLPDVLVPPKILPEAAVEIPKMLPLLVVATDVDNPKVLLVAGVLTVPETFDAVSVCVAILPNTFPSDVLLLAYVASKVLPLPAAVPAVPKILPLNVPTDPKTLPVVVGEAAKMPPPEVVGTSKTVPPDEGFDPPKMLPVVEVPKAVLVVVAEVITPTGFVAVVDVVLPKRPLPDVVS